MTDQITKKRNQHYVPKFYLKKFSIANNERQLVVFNLKGRRYVPHASLADQASSKFYYGKDGEIEDSLAISEGLFSKLFNEIINAENLPSHGSKDHRQILHFAVMTECRNPRRREDLEEVTRFLDKYMRLHPEFPEKYRNDHSIQLRLTDPIVMPFVNHNKHVVILSDLRCKLLINQTKIPFITSDNPIVQYNQFLEYYTKNISITGYASKGLQIIFPITPKLLIMLYDSQVYYVGGKKGRTVKLVNRNEIDQLNILQLLNCNSNVYGNETMSQEYIQSLYDKALSFIKPKESIVEEFTSIEHAVTILSQKSSHRIGLSLSQISFSTHASKFKPDNSVGYGRDFALDAIDAFRNDPRFKD